MMMIADAHARMMIANANAAIMATANAANIEKTADAEDAGSRLQWSLHAARADRGLPELAAAANNLTGRASAASDVQIVPVAA